MRILKLGQVMQLTLTILLLLSLKAIASPVDTYVFPDQVTKIRFQDLTYELRCPKCQNQNLADSNSPIAEDLRREVYNMLMEGKSDTEIMDFMVQRYGEFVLYRPRVNPTTYILWFSPILFILVGAMVIATFVRRKKAKPPELSEEQKQQLKSILKD
ncbi:cytochrome c-type biogenesis protein [Thalassotalea aquiviva]|uniref:cytochrome c-type biogenesis protein n=1 Tax=Thalassotalea aquiviva TaxID=3242415 RepID=UPI00352A8478